MTPEEMQKKFGPIIILAGLAIAASIYFNGDKDPYSKDIDEAIAQQKELKQKQIKEQNK